MIKQLSHAAIYYGRERIADLDLDHQLSSNPDVRVFNMTRGMTTFKRLTWPTLMGIERGYLMVINGRGYEMPAVSVLIER